MSVVSNSATHVDGYRGVATKGTTLRRLNQANMRKFELAEDSFLETIVGRRGGLRKILSQVEAVAPTNATVLLSGETGN